MLLKIIDKISTPSSNIKQSYRGQLSAHAIEICSGRNITRSLFYSATITLHLFLGTIFTPISCILWFSGFRFLTTSMRSVGGILNLDAFIRENRINNGAPRWKLYVCNGYGKIANPYSYNLYNRYVTFVHNPAAKSLLLPLFMNPFFKESLDHIVGAEANRNSRKFSLEGKQWNFLQDIWNKHDEFFDSQPLVYLAKEEIEKGKLLMAPHMDPNKKFVALHVRDSGYYGYKKGGRGEERSADIQTYEKTIRYLIARDFVVVRMGDSKMIPIDSLIERCGPNLVDYAHLEIRSDFLDCYLVSQCDFYLGLGSGLFALARVLGRPTCCVNFPVVCNALGPRRGDLAAIKTYRYQADGEVVPFEKVVRPPFSPQPEFGKLRALGVYLEDNTPEEIIATIREFLEQKDSDPTPLQERAKRALLPSNYSYSAKGNFSNAILRRYFPD